MNEYVRFCDGENSRFPHLLTVEHFEDSYEFTIVKDGAVTYSIEGKEYNVFKGQMIFINANVLHHRVDTDKNSIFETIVVSTKALFPGKMIDYYKKVSGDNRIPFLLFSSGALKHREVIEPLETAFELYKAKEEGYEFDIMSILFKANKKLNNYIEKIAGRFEEEHHEPKAMKLMIAYIQDNYDKKLSLSKIGEAAGMCRSRCCSSFKDYMPLSANDYLAYYRLAKSVELFENPDISFVQIAKAVGFGGASYYSEIFKKIVGSTPTEYRES